MGISVEHKSLAMKNPVQPSVNLTRKPALVNVSNSRTRLQLVVYIILSYFPGDSQTGKTAIFNRFVKNCFFKDSLPTKRVEIGQYLLKWR